MLFAAGFGTRMAPLTDDRPKPLIKVGGRALIDHALALADESGVVARKVVNLHYLADQIRAHLSDRPDIALSHETPDILDTGGGLREAMPLLGAEHVMALNTDAVWTGPNPLAALAGAWDADRMDALLLLVPRERALGHTGKGDFAIDPEGRLTRSPGHVYTGAQILSTGVLRHVPDRVFSLNRVWDIAQSRGRLFGIIHEGGWCDVGRPDCIAIAETMLREAADV
ncbi:nucleotidyltransferase family protein [Ostreiculturibacter nitratireducens]